jgi:hypothetical protein
MAVGPETDARVRSALAWLAAVQNETGSWGYDSAGGTALCVLALGEWSSTVSRRESLVKAASWLAQRWRDELVETAWDTAVVGRALLLVGDSENRTRRDIERWLLECRPSDDWSDRPHHAAEILNTLAAAGADLTLRDAWVRTIQQLLAEERYAPSVCGQAVFALLSSGGCDLETLEEPIRTLETYLETTRISNSEFLNYVHALRALAATGHHAEIVGVTLDKAFSDAYRRDGSWYHEPFMTAWALLALREAKEVRRVVIEVPALNSLVQHAVRSTQALEEPERRAWRLSLGASFTLGVSVSALVGINVFYSGKPEWVRWAVTTVATAAIAACLRIVRPKLR